MNRWEAACSDVCPIVAYLVVESSLPIFKRAARRKVDEPAHIQTEDMFSDLAAASQAEAAVETDKRQVYVLRLPYTEGMLRARGERGAGTPEWICLKDEEQL